MEVRSKGHPPGLANPDPKPCLLGLDDRGYLAFAYFDVQASHAAQVWYQPVGWLAPQPFPTGVSPQGNWVGYVHDGHFKVVTTDWVDRGNVILLDLGEVPQ